MNVLSGRPHESRRFDQCRMQQIRLSATSSPTNKERTLSDVRKTKAFLRTPLVYSKELLIRSMIRSPCRLEVNCYCHRILIAANTGGDLASRYRAVKRHRHVAAPTNSA